jgi:hypothetical protein
MFVMWTAIMCVAIVPTPLKTLPGSILPLRDFDPLRLATRFPDGVPRWREAELVHGRVGMLASAGFLVQEAYHPMFPQVDGAALYHMTKMPPTVWLAITLGVGIAEAVRIQKGWADPYQSMTNIQKLKADYDAGDLGFDPLGLRPDDPEAITRIHNVELSHGRLAMLAAAGFLAQEAVTGEPWGATVDRWVSG